MKKAGYIRFISLILLTVVVISALFSLSSCGEKNREYDEEDVLKAAEVLIKNSERLNQIYWGEGIIYSPDMSEANGAYFRADSQSLLLLGVNTVDDIIKLTRDTFTVSYANLAINTKLSSVSDDDGIQIYARYYQKYSALDDTPECIMVYKNADIFLKDKCVYDYSSLKVDFVSGQSIFVRIDLTVTNPDGESQSTYASVELIEEEDGFRINTPTYKRYDNGILDKNK